MHVTTEEQIDYLVPSIQHPCDFTVTACRHADNIPPDKWTNTIAQYVYLEHLNTQTFTWYNNTWKHNDIKFWYTVPPLLLDLLIKISL